MSNKKHRHKSLPEGVKLGEIHEDRIWVMHPTKGLRSKKVHTPDPTQTGIRLVDLFKHICKRKLG